MTTTVLPSECDIAPVPWPRACAIPSGLNGTCRAMWLPSTTKPAQRCEATPMMHGAIRLPPSTIAPVQTATHSITPLHIVAITVIRRQVSIIYNPDITILRLPDLLMLIVRLRETTETYRATICLHMHLITLCTKHVFI